MSMLFQSVLCDVGTGKAFDQTLYYILCAVLSIGVLVGIYLMSKVKLSVIGNRFSAVCMLLAIVLTLIYNDILPVWVLYIALAAGAVIGFILSVRVKMIQMPQMVALLNGLGGAASAIVGAFAVFGIGTADTDPFSNITAALALAVGMLTLTGSLVAAGKLHRVLPQKPVVYRGHRAMTTASLLIMLIGVVVFGVIRYDPVVALIIFVVELLISGFFGYIFAIRVGGADMPITISLLNSFSGVAGAIAGLAIDDLLLVAVGGIVGASGLLLTQIMCRSMNRKLLDILLGKTTAKNTSADKNAVKLEKTLPAKTAVSIRETCDIAKVSYRSHFAGICLENAVIMRCDVIEHIVNFFWQLCTVLFEFRSYHFNSAERTNASLQRFIGLKSHDDILTRNDVSRSVSVNSHNSACINL